MSRVLLFGATGQLAFRLKELLGENCTALDRAACDVSTLTLSAATMLVEQHRPDIIINAVAYTAVDQAETERELARKINTDAPGIMARAAGRTPFIHISTDYVFDGRGGAPYTETATPNPLNQYGLTKWRGDEAVQEAAGNHLIFRLPWLYDARGKNFLLTMKRLMAEKTLLSVVADQRGAPTAAPLAAAAIVRAAAALAGGTLAPGLYHLACGGDTTWHGFACAIADELRARKLPIVTESIVPITTGEYPTPAARPLDTRLDCSKLAAHGITLPHWRDALKTTLE